MSDPGQPPRHTRWQHTPVPPGQLRVTAIHADQETLVYLAIGDPSSPEVTPPADPIGELRGTSSVPISQYVTLRYYKQTRTPKDIRVTIPDDADFIDEEGFWEDVVEAIVLLLSDDLARVCFLSVQAIYRKLQSDRTLSRIEHDPLSDDAIYQAFEALRRFVEEGLTTSWALAKVRLDRRAG